MLLYWRKNDAGKCEPFTTYSIGCNKCVCSADGTTFCTRMVCHKSTNSLSEGSTENDIIAIKLPSAEKEDAASEQKERRE
ncbi:hypothetical protein HW555_002116 [Spodoptera exigua]|uniref:Pacifastin domain-containing protein n=1 Tax=Spodoptera exigua TaxID=7107 RepID=A0A835GNR0_SPOEX|nr:hypothetical protein HW555_002116 [Spodoptera exigua]KAH9632164.1 hypothetical protein HF086_011910 [Spodoptera exigua]